MIRELKEAISLRKRLQTIYDTLTDTFDSSGIEGDINGGVIEILKVIHNDVQDTLTRTQGTLTADGTVQTVYEHTDGTIKGIPQISINLRNMDADDTVIIRPSKKINSAGDFEQIGTDAENTYSGVQEVGNRLVDFDSVINQEGYKVTLEQTAEVSGYKNFDFEVFEV